MVSRILIIMGVVEIARVHLTLIRIVIDNHMTCFAIKITASEFSILS